MHAKCSLRKMHLEVGRKNVTRPGPIIKYLSRVLNEIHQSFNMESWRYSMEYSRVTCHEGMGPVFYHD